MLLRRSHVIGRVLVLAIPYVVMSVTFVERNPRDFLHQVEQHRLRKNSLISDNRGMGVNKGVLTYEQYVFFPFVSSRTTQLILKTPVW